MAEISVPACPIPIHQTKLTIANPQPMGMLMPQMPVPFMNSQPMAMVITPVRVKAIAKPTNQPKEVGRVRTMELILSVTEPKVCPGPRTGVSRRICGESIGGWPALMRSPIQGSDCARLQDSWYAGAHSIPPGLCNFAVGRAAWRLGYWGRWHYRKRWLGRGKLVRRL